MDLSHWAARLALCQMLARHAEYLEADPESAATFLRDCTEDTKPFVRAWAVTAFHQLGQRKPRFRDEAEALLARAVQDPAKSVQARLRRLK